MVKRLKKWFNEVLKEPDIFVTHSRLSRLLSAPLSLLVLVTARITNPPFVRLRNEGWWTSMKGIEGVFINYVLFFFSKNHTHWSYEICSNTFMLNQIRSLCKIWMPPNYDSELDSTGKGDFFLLLLPL